jgi:hypothetical protein
MSVESAFVGEWEARCGGGSIGPGPGLRSLGFRAHIQKIPTCPTPRTENNPNELCMPLHFIEGVGTLFASPRGHLCSSSCS